MTANRVACRVLLVTFGLQSTALGSVPLPPVPSRPIASPSTHGVPRPASGSSPVDLRLWSQEGTPANGNWEVTPDGGAVTQTINAGPTFFVSPDEHVNTTLRVRMRVGGSDAHDAFVGFVLGYQAPLGGRGHDPSQTDLVLLDWKKATDALGGRRSAEGWTLSRVHGLVQDPGRSFQAHEPGPLLEVVGRKGGSRTGWVHERDYRIAISYRTSRIRVTVDDALVLDVAGMFPAGRVGFYGYLPATVRFEAASLEATNGAPVANAGTDRTVDAGDGCGASVTLDGSRSTDPDGDALAHAWTGPFGTAHGRQPTVWIPAGVHTITLTATDGAGASDAHTVEVAVLDREAPVLKCDGPLTSRLPPARLAARGLSLPTPPASDNCKLRGVERDDPVAFVLGANTVRWTATDDTGWTATCEQTVMVVSATAPALSPSLATTQLWPPNHAMKDVGLTVVASDPSGVRPTIALKVWSDEPVDGGGDGDTNPDAQVDPSRLWLRAERSGGGDGRVYLIRATATNLHGETAFACATVTVPHSQSAAAINGVKAQATAARAACEGTGEPPAGLQEVASGPFGASDPTLPVRPILECVVNEGGGHSSAVFGYGNENPVPVLITLGADNTFTPNPNDRGQSTWFEPGRSPASQGAFTVPFESGNLVWTLRTRTATASLGARACTAPPATPIARDDAAETAAGVVVMIPVLANDHDPQGDPLTVIRIGAPSHGAASLNADGTVAYLPQADYLGGDSFPYTISDGRFGTARAIVTVTVTAPAPNRPPTVNTGSDQTINLPTNTVRVAGTVTDDGLPAGGTLTVQWSKISGPASVVFSNPASAVTDASFGASGTYVLRLLASDSQLTASDDVVVTVVPPNQAPLVSAGPDQTITLPTSTAQLTGAASDDGLPAGSSLALLWSAVSGPGSVAFANPTTASTTASFSAAGTYALRLSATDSDLTATDEVTIVVALPPLPTISIADAAVVEGASETRTAPLLVSLSAATDHVVTVLFRTDPGSASEGCDYLPAFGSLTIPAGSVSSLVPVQVVGDLETEPDETVRVVLGEPVGGLLGRAAATLVVTNDDAVNRAPSPITARTPAPGAADLPLDTALSWHGSDPDAGDVVRYDVSFGTELFPDGQSWQKFCATGAPSTTSTTLALDADQDRLLVFGGAGPGNEVLVLTNATGLGGAPTWTTLAPGGVGPSSRSSAAGAYDAAQGVFLVHGGCLGDCSAALADTWILSDASGGGAPTWSALPAAPLPRAGHLAGLDPAMGRFIVFGGSTGTSDLNDVSVLKNATGGGTPEWEQLPLDDPPPPRRDAAGVYDRLSNRLFVVGGRHGEDEVLGDAWVLTHANGLGGAPQWSQLSPRGEAPAARAGARAVYDAAAARLLIFGGTTAGRDLNTNFVFGDLWMLAGLDGDTPAWIPVQPAVEGPIGRFDGVAAYSPFSNRMVVAGGANNKLGALDLGDLWILKDAAGTLPLVSASQTAESYDPGPLAEGSSYFWRVVARDPHGAATGSSFASFAAGRPRLFIDDLSVAEGDSGATAVRFVVRLSRPSDEEVRAAFATSDGSAFSGEDYSATTGTVVFPAGTTERTVEVAVSGDTIAETDETFFLTLSAPVGARLTRPQATGTITNDDLANTAPLVSAGPDVTTTVPAVTLAGIVTDDGLPLGSTLTVQWSVVSGPGTVTLASPNAASTDATFGAQGAYVLRLSASDFALTSLDEVTVTIVPPPNLTPGPVDDSALVIDGQTLAVSGTLSVPVSNPSPTAVSAPFAVVFFEDRNGDAAYQPGTDALVGQGVVSGLSAGETRVLGATASGSLLFQGNVVYAFVDSGQEIAEANEADNVSISRPCPPPPPASFSPTLKWFYKSNLGGRGGVMSAPMVMDLDGDGGPEVVFIDDAAGALHALHGADGSPAFVLTDAARGLASFTHVAIGNLDTDPRPEIVAIGGGVNANRIVAFEHDGTIKWTAAVTGLGLGGGAPVLADLDGDGNAEVIVGNTVFNRDGTLRWKGSAGLGLNGGQGPVSLVVDLDMDGSPEVVAGNTAYRANGSIYWSRPIPDGFDAVGNFDADPYPEIVHVGAGQVRLFEHDGTTKWGPVSFPDVTSIGGPPAVADVDGDGIPEITVAGRTRLLVLRADGTVLWQAVTQDLSSQHTGVTAFDFDGDGAAEVVYSDELKLRIYRGRDGFVLFDTDIGNGTRMEYPVIADVDADGHADIVVAANVEADRKGVLVFSSPSWVGARKVWNQHTYHVTNVNDDGTIPASEAPSWGSSRAGYRQQAIVARAVGCVHALPDLVASYVRLSAVAGEHVLVVRIGNGGTAPALLPVPVSFYDGDPAGGGVRIGMVETGSPLLPGRFEDVTLHLPGSVRTVGSVFVAADDLGESRGRIVESDETNNVYDSGLALVASPGGPDLAVASVDTGALVTDAGDLAVSGMLSAIIRNQGEADVTASFSVTFFEDLDRNDALSAGDNVLGVTRLAGLAAGASTVVTVSVTGTLLFRDAPVHVFVDSGLEIAESEERNNIIRTGAACSAQPPDEPFVPQVKWAWTGSTVAPTSDQVSGVPVVVDLDGDGSPEIVFTSLVGGPGGPLGGRTLGVLRAVRGTNGAEVFSVTIPQVFAGTALAAGDIDGDSRPEILALAPNRVLAFEHNGILKWQSPVLEFASGAGGAALGDLDGDGVPEIVVGRQVLNANGTIRWTGTGGSGGGAVSSIVVDLDLDGVPEVLAGNTAYRASGSIVWQNTAVADGFTAVANFDDDPYPEVVVVGSGNAWLLEHTGAIKWGPLALPGGLLVGPPVVADFDGDGRVDIAVGSPLGASYVVSVLDGRGFLRWKQVRAGQWSIGGLFSASAFDFDADGAAEVVYADSSSVRVLRGTDGAVLYETALPRPATASYPVVADVDGDGNAELVVAVGGPTGQPHGLYVLGDARDGWVGARKVWNQYTYHITNVNDDGTIPAHEVFDPLNFNSFRRSGLQTGFPTASPDLTVSYARRTASPSSILLTVRVGNAGAGVAPAGVAVSFWDGAPGGALLGYVFTTTSLSPGHFEDLALTLAGEAASQSTVQVKVDDPPTGSGGSLECRESNNVLDTGLRLNQAPSVGAGVDRTITLPVVMAALVGSVIDDGLPVGSLVTLTWSVVTGPGRVTFADPTEATTTATFELAGTYTLRLTATDTRLTAFDEVAVTVTPPNQAPVVSAGEDHAITLPPTDTVTLNGSVSDDGLPIGASLSLTWSLVNAPAGVLLSSPFLAVTPATFTAPGTYVLRLTATDTALTVTDDVVVTVVAGNTPPVVSAGADQTVVLSGPGVALLGSATDDGLPTGSTVAVAWSLQSGPAPVSFSNPASLATTASFDAPGAYLLLLTATDGVLSASDHVAVTIQAEAPVGDPPVVTLASPTDGSAITQPVDIVGRVSSDSLANWKLQIRSTGDTTFSTLASGLTPVDGVITRFDPTLLLNGLHEVVFRATDTAGRIGSTVITAVVKDNQKVGNFTVSFSDLEVPVAGLPIRVTRTYDSRDKGIGDFGFGWRVDLSNARVQESAQAGLLWYGDRLPGFISTYCLTPTRAAIVSITTPDGRVHEFEPVLTPQCSTGAPIRVASYAFRPRPGTTTQGTLSVAGNNHVLPIGSWPGPMQLYGETDFRIFDPNTYLLTLPDGREFEVNQPRGLTKVRDLSGNTLNVTSGGITFQNPDVPGSTKGIVFTRDAQGRITAITDPSGESATYGYDANGDLASFTDREENTTTFTYEPAFPHHLKGIKDPLGRTPIKNDYYPDGRIKSHTDAFGKTITYTHDVAGRQEIVVDREGAQRVLEYDERGNVLKETQPDGKVMRRTFDDRQNRLTETEPYDPASPPSPIPTTVYTYDPLDNLLSTTDPASNTTSFTYNSRKQVLTTTDAKGKVTTNEYDAKGNLLKTTDSLTNVTGYTYDAQGNVLSQTVTVNGVTQVTGYEYDSFGNLKRETDALGHETSYAYDPSGNRLTQTTTRTTPSGVETLLTSYTHDKLGRLTRTTDPDNTYTETAYDALGKQLSTRDKLGRITSYTYDDMGRLTKTTHADTTTDESTYDGEGRRLTSKDRAGRTTTYEYDQLGRLKKTSYPDLSFTTSTYDAAGRLASSTDARGKTTTYEYDAAGRRTKVKDALGNETVFTYDANGNQKTVRDARLNTTTCEYDELNRRTRTIFPPAGVGSPATFATTGYDALGRRVSETDQAGKTTRFEYDKLGRLTAVVDALDHRTTYGYDEIGNRTIQTDANSHVTRFEYDKLGRQTKRILPDGKTESMTYDETGNLKTRTDFMARSTTYDYDYDNRLLSRGYPDSTSVGFTYTATGRRRTAVDGRGTTTYDYDTRDRLKLLTYPDGRKLEYDYDPQGNRTKLTAILTAVSLVSNYTFDPLSRLETVTDPESRVHTYGYDANGNRESLLSPNGTDTRYQYDPLNRLRNLTTTHPASGRMIQSYAYELSPAGNRKKVTEHDGNVREWTYDDLYRLTHEKVSDTLTTIYEKAFAYDSVGNRQTQTTTGSGAPGTPTAPGTITYGYDDRDRLLTENAIAYSYDDNGNLVTKDAEATYTWDFDNRLVRVQKTGGTVIEHAYDADGNRVRTKVTPPTGPPETTEYLVDTSGSLSHAVAETDHAGNLKAYYVRGDDLLSILRNGPDAWTTRFYHADGLGSIRRLTDESGNITDGYTYSAFGAVLSHAGADPQPYAFTGEPLDLNSGFQYHRARWMDPRVGRFVGMDPFEGLEFEPATLHRYLYVAANPLAYVDPNGENFLSVSLTLNVALTTINTIATLQTGGVNAAIGSLLIDAATGAIPGSSAFKLLRTFGNLARAGRVAITGRKSFEALARGYKSFKAFKRAAGPAGAGLEWHHIIEQHAANVARFGAEAIHSAGNLIRVPEQIHRRISGYYGSKDFFTGGLKVRDWLKIQAEEEQLEFGLKVLRDFGVLP
jgi:RHS repeat-associated protein